MSAPIKQPIPRSEELLERAQQALTPHRLPLLIGIDGADGIGKSSLASWLAWQLGMPAIQLDLYLTSIFPIRWLTDDLARAVSRRLDRSRPVILDGLLQGFAPAAEVLLSSQQTTAAGYGLHPRIRRRFFYATHVMVRRRREFLPSVFGAGQLGR